MTTATPTPPPKNPTRQALFTGLSCGVALVLGVILLVNLFAQFRLSDVDYDPNHWWISFRPLPRILEQLMSLYAAIIFLAYAAVPSMSTWRRRATRPAVEILCLLVVWNAIDYYGALGRGLFRTVFPVPFAVFIGAALAAVWFAAGGPRPRRTPLAWLATVAAVLLMAVVFPLLQMFCFGLADRRSRVAAAPGRVTVAVVFCADVAHEPGTDRLVARVNTAIDLVNHDGASLIYVSGDLPAVASAEVRKLVGRAGMSPKLEFDGAATDAEATIRDVSIAFDKKTVSLLVVSDYNTLARIDMLFAQDGRLTLPVPTEAGHVPFAAVVGEIPRLWKCYVAALTR